MDFVLIGIAIICVGLLSVVVSVYVGVGKKSSSSKDTKDQMIGVTQEMGVSDNQKLRVTPSSAQLASDDTAADVMKPLNDILSRWSGRKWVNDGSGYDVDPYKTALDGCVMDLSAAMEKIELILRERK